MQFSTPIPIPKSNRPIDYHSKVVLLGSCFAVNMSEKFEYFKFRNTANPFGILFHPLAIEKFIGYAIDKKTFTEKDIFFHNERWHCFDAHSDVSRADKNDMLGHLNSVTKSANTQIAEATHIIITLGTAWVYTNIDSGEIVANCHKVPQKQFGKILLSVDSIRESLANVIALLKNNNPEINIIFTVSPVRHIKDGFAENQWSKSNLISAVHQALSLNQTYFPSYEIMMDELRDYRFYAEDMLHPNQIAIDYIWERFSETHISTAALSVMEEIGNIQKALAHKPFSPDSAQHRDFLQKLQGRIAELQSRHNHIVF